VKPKSFRLFLLGSGIIIVGLGGFFLISQNKPSPSLPQPLSSSGEKTFALRKFLADAQITVSNGPYLGRDNQSIEVIISNNTRVIFSLNDDLQKQTISLQLILKETRMEQEINPKVIDLRGSKAHVAF